MRGFTLLLGVSLVMPVADLSAQQILPIESGARVRVTAPNCGARKQATTFEAWRGDTLVLGTVDCPLGSVTRLDVSRGRKGISWVGGAVGFVVGAAAGAEVAYLSFQDDYGSPCSTSSGTNKCGVVVTSFALGGAVAGALLMRRERWEEVPLDRLRVSFVSKWDGRLAFGFRVAF